MRICRSVFFIVGLLWVPLAAIAQTFPLTDELLTRCAAGVHPKTLRALLNVESAYNPFAIGVVGTSLARQPTRLSEAIETAKQLQAKGHNFSLGLSQVNRYNLAKYGATIESIFEPCRNLQIGGAILQGCYSRALANYPTEQAALQAAFSCYYAGNFRRGFQPDEPGAPSYVQKVVASALPSSARLPVVPAVDPSTPIHEPIASTSPAKSLKLPRANHEGPGAWVVFTEASKPLDITGAVGQPIETNNSSAPKSPAPLENPNTAALEVARPAIPAAPFVQFVQ